MVDRVFKTIACIFPPFLSSLQFVERPTVKVRFPLKGSRSFASCKLKLLKFVLPETSRVFDFVSSWARILKISNFSLPREKSSFNLVSAVCFLEVLKLADREGARSEPALT